MRISRTLAALTVTCAVLLTTAEVCTGRRDCYDRVVFEFDGSATGYSVGYGEVYTEGEGLALSP
ncbi:AMIN-like domain-containing (lipo)protein [Micromonospora sp. DT229]|uniref:AMIN-like domain-containing (lipo)protein n=1 Tax=Micromonospora sp. DT229 TaxID=3393430 RepID=UPI003CE86DBE